MYCIWYFNEGGTERLINEASFNALYLMGVYNIGTIKILETVALINKSE